MCTLVYVYVMQIQKYNFLPQVEKDCELTSICGWFDCLFDPISEKLSTSPYCIPTHWAQTNFYLKQPLKVRFIVIFMFLLVLL